MKQEILQQHLSEIFDHYCTLTASVSVLELSFCPSSFLTFSSIDLPLTSRKVLLQFSEFRLPGLERHTEELFQT